MMTILIMNRPRNDASAVAFTGNGRYAVSVRRRPRH
jgi:hypothetical protein